MYTLTISKEHAYAVLAALELYERIAMGQTNEISNQFEGKNDSWENQRAKGLDAVLEHLKRILFPDLEQNAYYGIMSEKSGKQAHLCYEVFCALRHCVSHNENPLKPGEMPTVWHDKPRLFPSKVKPEPKCEASK
jgi:hypothetical protein